MSRPPPLSAHGPIDDPQGAAQREGSRMPLPYTGLRRLDHPDPQGLPPPEVKVTAAWRVSCDGGEGALGHPRVWLSIPHETGFIDCGYCDARFVHEDFAAALGAGAAPQTAPPGDRDAAALDARGTHGRGLNEPADHTQPADRREGVVGPQQGGDEPSGRDRQGDSQRSIL